MQKNSTACLVYKQSLNVANIVSADILDPPRHMPSFGGNKVKCDTLKLSLVIFDI